MKVLPRNPLVIPSRVVNRVISKIGPASRPAALFLQHLSILHPEENGLWKWFRSFACERSWDSTDAFLSDLGAVCGKPWRGGRSAHDTDASPNHPRSVGLPWQISSLNTWLSEELPYLTWGDVRVVPSLAKAIEDPEVLRWLESARAAWIASQTIKRPVLPVVTKLHSLLAFASGAGGLRGLTVAYGPPGIGASTTARDWCQSTAGLCRYVDMPAGACRRNLLSAVNSALDGEAAVWTQLWLLQSQVGFSLGPSGPMLVLDHADRMWSTTNVFSLEWVLQQVEQGTRLVLIADKQRWEQGVTASSNHRGRAKNHDWCINQLKAALLDCVELPSELTAAHLTEAIRYRLPKASSRAVESMSALLAGNSASLGDLERLAAGIDQVMAGRPDDEIRPQDVAEAVRVTVGPAQRAWDRLCGIDERPKAAKPKRAEHVDLVLPDRGNQPQNPEEQLIDRGSLQAPRNAPARPLQTQFSRRTDPSLVTA